MHEILCFASAGGVGTTFLIKWFGQYLETNNYKDSDRLKHMRKPPGNGVLSEWKIAGQPSPLRVRKSFYIFGNPANACVLHFSRVWADAHVFKITDKDASGTTFETFLMNRVGVYGFEKHFDN